MKITLDSTLEEAQREYSRIDDDLRKMRFYTSALDYWLIFHHRIDKGSLLRDLEGLKQAPNTGIGSGWRLLESIEHDATKLTELVNKHPIIAKRNDVVLTPEED